MRGLYFLIVLFNVLLMFHREFVSWTCVLENKVCLGQTCSLQLIEQAEGKRTLVS